MKRAGVLVVMMVGSVDDERLFSHTNYIKVDERKLLGHEFLEAAVTQAVHRLFDHDTFTSEDALRVWRAQRPRQERLSKKWMMGQKSTKYTIQVASMKRAKVACYNCLVWKELAFSDLF
jgi:hypothetical protein